MIHESSARTEPIDVKKPKNIILLQCCLLNLILNKFIWILRPKISGLERGLCLEEEDALQYENLKEPTQCQYMYKKLLLLYIQAGMGQWLLKPMITFEDLLSPPRVPHSSHQNEGRGGRQMKVYYTADIWL